MINVIPIFSVLFFLLFLPFYSFGKCIEGNCVNGKGTFISPNGDKYEGDFKDGKPNGIGTLSNSDVEGIYVGEVKDGILNAQGTLKQSDGSTIAGVFENGFENGHGYPY